ncbi:enoyl-CoA hydratase/isomerase family protein [Mycobacterium sp. AT1]|uniref:enoyl-CoA hydratase/isomerase family protein n=1 Tax=Mycobacterium sp. AT1 TaxID=1961706 RepID=UPI0009AEDFCC|nr:enoyl-CoA hydratase/isomerase family protein [Mycobacterium sp. AT1]OPX11901.1 enoyl-CoA hydratase [Mycobacterium sp. AT1]
MTDFTDITTSVTDGIGTITFNRPDRRNALTPKLFRDLTECLINWRNDDTVAVVIVTGGDRWFSAGLDLQLQSSFTDDTRFDYGDLCLRAYGQLLDYPKPTIAAISGPALGGGLDIAVFCDIRIGARGSFFGYPQVKFGLTPYFSPLWKIVGLSQAKLLTLSGQRIDDDEALRIGLVDRLVADGTAVAAATDLAGEIAETTVKSAMFNKELMLRSPAMDPISALSFETSMYREVIWHPDVTERMNAAFARVTKSGVAAQTPHPRPAAD